MIETNVEHASTLFSALGSQIRLKILLIINETKRPLHIKAIANELHMDYAAVYRHIEVLKRSGLVQIYEVGRSRVVSPLCSNLLRQMLSLAEQAKKSNSALACP